MGFFDLLTLIIDNLGRRKGRVALTAIGVIIGTAAVVVLVSLAIGLQKNANEQLTGIGDLTQIQVYPGYKEQGPGMMMVAVGPGQPDPNVTLITDDTLAQITAMAGVTEVIPRDYLMAGGSIKIDRLETYPNFIGIDVNDLSTLGIQAAEGTLELSKGNIVVGAMVKNQFYDPRWRPGQTMPEPPELMGKTLRLTLSKYSQEGTETRKVIPLTVVGTTAESRGESDYSIYLPLDDLVAMNEWALGKRINRNRDGYNMLIVKVDNLDTVLEVTDQITALGLQAYTPQSFVQGINSFYLVLQVIFGGVGAIALLVAAIGIANTMAMAILERTREIGLMKAIGATNRDVLSVFLGEAAGIGFLGGLGGVIIGWSAGQVINVLAMAYLAGQAVETGGAPPSVAVFTPTWLPIFTLVFATIIGLVSGLYPALRAATLIPVEALKYE
ncbi:MAG TPA: ABC transporter permease [Anaerolineales bacterium]|nr:ABC transporter permease [Anaerolineales bacterium]